MSTATLTLPASCLVQDRLARVWGTAQVERASPEAWHGRFVPMPDFEYLRGLFEEYEALSPHAPGDVQRRGELDAWLVGLRPQLVPIEGDPLALLSLVVTRTEAGLEFTALRHPATAVQPER